MGYILGLYRDNGKEHGNYYSILGLHREYQGYIGSIRVLGLGARGSSGK